MKKFYCRRELKIKKEVKQVTKDNNHDGIYFALSKLNLFKEL